MVKASLVNALRTLAVLFVVLAATTCLGPGRAEAQVNVTGQWTTLPYLMPINPIHFGQLRTGKVLVVAGSENDPNKHAAGISKAAVWDLNAGTFTIQSPPSR